MTNTTDTANRIESTVVRDAVLNQIAANASNDENAPITAKTLSEFVSISLARQTKYTRSENLRHLARLDSLAQAHTKRVAEFVMTFDANEVTSAVATSGADVLTEAADALEAKLRQMRQKSAQLAAIAAPIASDPASVKITPDDAKSPKA